MSKRQLRAKAQSPPARLRLRSPHKTKQQEENEDVPEHRLADVLRNAVHTLSKGSPKVATLARAKQYAKVLKKHLSTRQLPGSHLYDLPGPQDYKVSDPRDMSLSKGGVEFGGAGIKRELTQVRGRGCGRGRGRGGRETPNVLTIHWCAVLCCVVWGHRWTQCTRLS